LGVGRKFEVVKPTDCCRTQSRTRSASTKLKNQGMQEVPVTGQLCYLECCESRVTGCSAGIARLTAVVFFDFGLQDDP
jgi:hypothetical protein